MNKYISLDKRSKKAQREYHAKQRRTWGEFNPVTRSVPSGKTYNRKKNIYNGQSERENKNTRAAESIFFCKRIVEDTEAESNKTKYMFQYPDLDNEVHTPDFYLMMRITDDIASEEVSAAKNNGTATNSQKAKANAEARSEQTLASTQPTLLTE